MARCGCAAGCACAVEGSAGAITVSVAGNGSAATPYVITADAGGSFVPARPEVLPDDEPAHAVVESDEQDWVLLTSAVPVVVTLPQDADADLPVGSQVRFARIGAGAVSFAAGTGATAVGTPGLNMAAQYSTATALKYATDSWLVFGDLAA